MPDNSLLYIGIILSLLVVIGVLLISNLRKAKLQPAYTSKSYNYGFLGKALAMVGIGLLVGVAYIGTTTINQQNTNLNNQSLASTLKADIDIIQATNYYSVYVNIWNSEVLENLKFEFETVDIFGNRKFDTIEKNSNEIISINVGLNPKPVSVNVKITQNGNLLKELIKGF